MAETESTRLKVQFQLSAQLYYHQLISDSIFGVRALTRRALLNISGDSETVHTKKTKRASDDFQTDTSVRHRRSCIFQAKSIQNHVENVLGVACVPLVSVHRVRVLARKNMNNEHMVAFGGFLRKNLGPLSRNGSIFDRDESVCVTMGSGAQRS